MLKELFTAALGMLPQQTRLEVIANNMANASTAGFKRENVFERNLIDARANFYNIKGDCESDDPPIGSYTDFAAGSFQQTGNQLDIALENKGFFMLKDEQGNDYLSRAGHFTLSRDGNITAMDGKLLMGEDGPITLGKEFMDDPLNSNESKSVNLKISENGEVFANEYLIGTIQIADVKDQKSLDRISNQYFIPTQNTEVEFIDPKEVSMRQGWLEGSNVDIIKEMVSMIELQRQFEAGSKVITTNEATLDNSIRLGRYY
ncbi:MAG: flagellar basal-body rod protein FlgF [Bacteroidota bacterium]|nr:flagellar basal-body rod protein FlgF [Bacteroidota bacterium]